MSNYLAVAAVTASLRNLLLNVESGVLADPVLADTQVTTKPLDKAHTSDDVNQLNVFLYHTAPNPALRNMDMIVRSKPGEGGRLPLALNLYYLITAYGRGNEDIYAHRLLGRAMSVLHDYPALLPQEIKLALPGNDLYQQVELVRITPQNLSVDEMFRLWATFQTAYRISVVYEFSVILIESTLPISAPLPVLSTGGLAQPSLTPPFPTLTTLTIPRRQPSALPGDLLELEGFHLDGDSVEVLISGASLVVPVRLAPEAGGSAERLTVRLAGLAAELPVGVYRITVIVRVRGEQDRITNDLPFALAPQLVAVDPPEVTRDEFGAATIRVICAPQILPDQRVALLLGDREVESEPHTGPTSTLTFIARNIAPGEYPLRLRVNGIDSHLVDRAADPPTFDPKAKVVIR